MSIGQYRNKDARREYMRDLLRGLRKVDPERFREYGRQYRRRQALKREAQEMRAILGGGK